MTILFTGDFLRPDSKYWLPTQHYNIRWLHDLFGRTLHRMTGEEVGYLAWNSGGVTKGGLTGAEISSIYDACGVPRSIHGWAALYEQFALPRSVRRLLDEKFRDAFVIGFEIPPVIKHFLLANGNRFLDVMVHPVRFHDDVFFGIQSSEAAANEALARYAIGEDEIQLVAGVVAATAGRLSHPVRQPGTRLVLMQSRYDKTQIRDGRFIGIADVMAPAAERGLFDAPVLVKPHPMEPENPHLKLVTAALRNCAVTTDNFYTLLCSENVEHVVSLSSSTCTEARYFGKDAEYLHKNPFALSYAGDEYSYGFDSFISVKDSYYGLAFWADVLSGMGLPGIRAPGAAPASLATKPNRTRTSLRSFWGYNEIDTDIAVRACRP